MAEPGIVGKVQGPVSSIGNIFWNWVVPLLGLGIGYLIGDRFGVTAKLNALSKGYLQNSLGGYVKNPTALLTAFIFFGIGVGAWKVLPGALGRFVGMIFVGMGVKTILGGI